MNILYLCFLIECASLKYCETCKYFKSHFPHRTDYGTCPLFPGINQNKNKRVQEIDYKYCFRKCNCELYFKDSLFLMQNSQGER